MIRKFLYGAVMLVVVVVAYLCASDGMVHVLYDKRIHLTILDTVRGIDTGRVTSIDTTTIDTAHTIFICGSGNAGGTGNKPDWSVFKPRKYITFDSTGLTQVAITIDSFSGQYPDSGFVCQIPRPLRPGGWVKWKWTIYSDSGSSYHADSSGGGGKGVRTKLDTGAVMIIPPLSWYAIHARCTKMTQKDSVYLSVAVQNKLHYDDYLDNQWQTVTAFVFTDTSLATHNWAHYSLVLAADTALAKGGHLGNAWRVISTAVDSESAPAYINRTTDIGARVFIMTR